MTLATYTGNVPNRLSGAATFSADADYYHQYFAAFIPQFNFDITALNTKTTTGVSTTTNTISTGTKTFTVSPDKNFQGGMFVVLADSAAPSTNSVVGQVTSYNSTTGVMVVEVLAAYGSGTKSDWIVSQTGSPASGAVDAGDITGSVAIANGGTGATTADGALTALGGTTIGTGVFKAATTAASATALGLSADTGASLIGFKQSGVGAVARTMEAKAREFKSVKDFGAVGDGVTDDTAAIQAAINAHKCIYLPIGTYKITSTLRESTNGGALRILGEHRKFSILKASGLAAPILWVGNSNGHGNYRADFSNFTIDGVNKTTGSVGMILHESGTSHVHDVDIKNVDVACKAVGVIGTLFGGKSEWASCNGGLLFSDPTTGTPSGIDDLTTTASPLTLNANANVVENIWFSAIAGDVVVVKGGMTHIKSVVLQGCGSDINRDLITFQDANESYQFRDGSSFEGWIEGGTYRYAVAIRNSTGTKIGGRTYIAGSSSALITNFPKEGGIYKDTLSRDIVFEKGISIYGYFVATPTEGRLANGAVYTQGDLRRDDVFTPYISTQSLPYYEGLTNPTIKRGHNDFEIVLTTLATPTIAHDSHGIVSSVTRNSVGDYSINFNLNRIVLPAYHITVQARTISATAIVNASPFGYGSVGSERIIVMNQAGTLTDPYALTLRFKAAWQGA
jgi:hypothetical protein